MIYRSEKLDFARDLWFGMKLILFALNHVVCITWQIEIRNDFHQIVDYEFARTFIFLGPREQ